jgi:hypothetical protein
MRRCRECGSPIVGRSDKQFCGDSCRNSYHNRSNSETKVQITRINRILKRNYAILEEILSEKSNHKKSFKSFTVEDLLREGFNFVFFTSVCWENSVCRFSCYDICYILETNGSVIIYKRNNIYNE